LALESPSAWQYQPIETALASPANSELSDEHPETAKSVATVSAGKRWLSSVDFGID
jgi:hypothetical protein